MFTIRHITGDMDVDPDPGALVGLIDELDQADGEHTDVSVEVESGWGLSAFANGLVVWENVEEDEEPRHLAGVERSQMVAMFETLAAGDLPAIEAYPWIAGYS
jgi:hypothetical protein